MTTPNPLEILYQDDYFVAVNKPPGLLVHRSPIDKREKQFALQMVRNQVGCRVYPVHRLDRPTSGVLLFALSSDIAGQAGQLYKTGQIRKKYIAVVRGFIPERGTIDHPVKEVKDRYLRPKNQPGNQAAKIFAAITDYRQLAKIELPFAVDKYNTARYSLAALYPKTGRRHQLRLHMKHISHHIIGDTKYGKDVHNKFFVGQFNCKGLLLSAVKLSFVHPVTKADVTITAPPNTSISLIIKQFNWNILTVHRGTTTYALSSNEL